jgi:hypothetical protein
MPSVLANQTIVNRDGNELNNPHFAFRRHTSIQGVNPFDIDLPEPPEPDEDEEYELDFGRNTRHRPMELTKSPSLLTQHGYTHML